MPKPKVGNKAPDIALPSTDGSTMKLSELRGERVVLFFYPKDATPGCTLEGQDFRDLHARFRRRKTRVFGISRDNLASHDKFREKHSFPFHLLADESEKACKAYDVIKEKNMYGKKVMGIERSTFLIDENGVLQREWRKVTVDGHAAEVLAAVSEL